uniref:Uncharacterized protein n=1 Tax=viral metagenome TaxID=1070528 RepID=A0A6C0AD66_9ZZZZ
MDLDDDTYYETITDEIDTIFIEIFDMFIKKIVN